ncbi:Zn-ribbon domain-containing OB-fold protein [Halobacterium yunchengense]|uniref:Zn-ribbon domain-containing OB-fold protein n=1 Tax=Halobacterium yunchengense TaxID=3108497 RepID=UPI003009BB14
MSDGGGGQDAERVSSAATACEACGETWAYDRVRCPSCGGESFRELALGVGELVATTVSRVPPSGVRSPNPLGVARFPDADVQVTAQLADGDLAADDRVVLAGDYELRDGRRGPRLERADD